MLCNGWKLQIPGKISICWPEWNDPGLQQDFLLMFCMELCEIMSADSLILNLTEYACQTTWFNVDNFVCAKKIQNNTETQNILCSITFNQFQKIQIQKKVNLSL
jgi:hypothetical protein